MTAEALRHNPVMNSRVLIVDDHDAFRAAARTMLEEMGLEVVGEAANGEAVMEMFELSKPDIVLLDIQLPGIDGIEVARTLFGAGHYPVLVLTSSRDAEDYGTRLRALPDAVFIGKTNLSSDALAAAIDNDCRSSATGVVGGEGPTVDVGPSP